MRLVIVSVHYEDVNKFWYTRRVIITSRPSHSMLHAFRRDHFDLWVSQSPSPCGEKA